MTTSSLIKLAILLFTILITVANAQDYGWYNSKENPYSISILESQGYTISSLARMNLNGETKQRRLYAIMH
jgi:hypothetical protein